MSDQRQPTNIPRQPMNDQRQPMDAQRRLRDDLLAAAPDACERERRRIILDDIEARIREDGPRQARPSPDRAHQFMPFSALKGYRELIRQEEAKAAAIGEGQRP